MSIQDFYPFLLALTPLVFIHELGHFLFCKLFNVRADVFSIGFGPKLLKKKVGETEYCISLIPLGGYVKILGQDPREEIAEGEKDRALYLKPKWQRFWIIFGGPLFNILGAILIYIVMFSVGVEKRLSVVSRVVPGSYASEQGFKEGDLIIAINKEPSKRYDELFDILNDVPNKTTKFVVQRDQSTVELNVNVPSKLDLNKFGQFGERGHLPGLDFIPLGTVVGIANPGSIAAKSGLKTFDQILNCNGLSIETWTSLSKCLENSNSNITLKVKRGEVVGAETPDVVISGCATLETCGIENAELFINAFVESSVAEKAGLKKGDQILTFGGEKVFDFNTLRNLTQKFKDTEQEIKVLRDGNEMVFKIKSEPKTAEDSAGIEYIQYYLGIYPTLNIGHPATESVSYKNPIKLLSLSLEETWRWSKITVQSFYKLITGEVSGKNLGGPIAIGMAAKDTLKNGWLSFLNFIAIISINLAILNLLPVPVLDGGHIAIIFLETLFRKPLQGKKLEYAQQVGLTALLLLIGFAIYNDLSRVLSSDPSPSRQIQK